MSSARVIQSCTVAPLTVAPLTVAPAWAGGTIGRGVPMDAVADAAGAAVGAAVGAAEGAAISMLPPWLRMKRSSALFDTVWIAGPPGANGGSARRLRALARVSAVERGVAGSVGRTGTGLSLAGFWAAADSTAAPGSIIASASPGSGDAGPEADAGAGDPRLAALEARLIDSAVLAALQAARGVPDRRPPVLRSRLAARDAGAGNPAARGPADAGTPRRRDDGGFVTVADLLESLRADPVYGRAFEASGKGGSGTPTAGRAEAGPLTESADDPRAIARHVADIAAGRVRVA